MGLLYLVTRSPFRSSRVRTALSLIECHLNNQEAVGLIMLNDSVIASLKRGSFAPQLTNLNNMGLKLLVSAADLEARGINAAQILEFCECVSYDAIINQIMDKANQVVSWT